MGDQNSVITYEKTVTKLWSNCADIKTTIPKKVLRYIKWQKGAKETNWYNQKYPI